MQRFPKRAIGAEGCDPNHTALGMPQVAQRLQRIDFIEETAVAKEKPIEEGDTWKVFAGPTPTGGFKAVCYFFRIGDDGGRVSARPEEATQCEIHEIDAEGRVIMTTLGHLAHGG